MADRAGRRDPRSFEPPPWERAQFEELAKLKTAEHEAETEDSSEEAEVVQVGGGTTVVDVTNRAVVEVIHPPAASGDTAGAEQASPVLDEAAMLEMMARLSEEEPPVVREIWRLAVVASTVLGSIGLMMIVFGAVGLTRTARAGLTGVLGGAILIVFGLGMIALAVWMVVRTLKQRGVL